MYVGPYALQRSFKEMELSMYYRTEVLQRPEGMEDWVRCLLYNLFQILCLPLIKLSMYIVLQNEYAIQVNKEIGYDWMDGEEMVGALFKILLLFVSFIVILFSIW
jgi:hypothetical protein